jgi:hypothetical protein
MEEKEEKKLNYWQEQQQPSTMASPSICLWLWKKKGLKLCMKGRKRIQCVTFLIWDLISTLYFYPMVEIKPSHSHIKIAFSLDISPIYIYIYKALHSINHILLFVSKQKLKALIK